VEWIQALLQQAGLIRKLSPHESFDAAVARLRTQLVVEPAIDSQIIWIRYRDPDPVLASKVVNKVVEEYQYQHPAIHINRAESSFYAEQIEKVKKELKGLQERLLGLRKESGIVSYSEQSKSLLKKLETYDNALTNGQKEIIRLRAKVDNIQTWRESEPNLLIPLPELAQDPQIADLENKLVELQSAEATLLQRYSPKSWRLASVRDQIGKLQVQIRDQVSVWLERELARLRELQAEEQALEQTIKVIKEDLAQMPATEMNLTNLDREIDTKQEILSILMKKYQDSLLAKSADRTLENVKVLSLAAVPLKPTSPNLPLNLALGLVLSLVTSFSVAFFLEYWDDSLKNPEDVERYLGRTAFASVPEFPA
ncbi:MAG TPA: GNVR domain-containing protein, partial [Desulfobaccales bacterium]|nr:GNVR domain-containing protein [Desulfobaccales bacterium]